MFDRGLWSISDDFRVLVAHKIFKESGPEFVLLSAFENQQILLPQNPNYWPDKQCLKWHREHRLGKRRSEHK